MIKEPKLRKGMKVKCHNGFDFEVKEICNTYEEVEQYDHDGECAKDLKEYQPFDDAIYIVARDMEDDTFHVFCCSRESIILGD